MIATFYGLYKAIVTKKKKVTLNFNINYNSYNGNTTNVTLWIT